MAGRRPPAHATTDRLARAVAPDYELRELLGRGGFGEVYAAWDAALKREVAIKTLRPELLSHPEVVQRFRREAEAAARLRHPNILSVYAVGERDGVVFFVMPRVHGESLRACLQRDPQPPLGEVRRILTDVASALQTAHAAGVVHRDVKPDNILLEGDERRVLVTDFGIAKALDIRDGTLTGTGVVVGSPDYMSPEQGSGDAVDHRADVYSLGVVAFEMIAGARPFGEGGVLTILMRHATEAPPPLLELRPACPGDLAAVVERALEKVPAARWASMGDLRHALLVADPHAAPEPALPARVHPLRGLAPRVVGYAVLVVAAIALDRLMGWAAAVTPLVLIGIGLGVALDLGRLRLGAADARASFRSPIPSRMGDAPSSTRFGRYASIVGRVVSDRMAIRGMLARLSAGERKALTRALPEVDRLVAEVAAAAEQLHRLEHGAGRDAREPRRRQLEQRLDRATGALTELRRALRHAGLEGVAGVHERLASAAAMPMSGDAAARGEHYRESQQQPDRPER